MKLLSETLAKAENRLKFKLLYVSDERLKEYIRNFYLSLVNDVGLLRRIGEGDWEKERDTVVYLRDKVRYELES